MKKKKYIVRTTAGYEFITTDDAYCKAQLMLQYAKKGYKVWDYPMWLARLTYKLFKMRILRGTTAEFEKFVPGTGQIIYYHPYSEF